jgi:hypothetical protein
MVCQMSYQLHVFVELPVLQDREDLVIGRAGGKPLQMIIINRERLQNTISFAQHASSG